MADGIREEITTGELAGRFVLVDRRKLTGAFMEDVQSGQARLILDALSQAVVGGDLPEGTDRAGLRKLPIEDLNAVMEAVARCMKVPKR